MGGWSSKPRQGMGTNLSVPNPLGFFPAHQLDPAFQANSDNPDCPQAQGILTTVPTAPPPASTNRQLGRKPTPLSPPLRDTHPQAIQSPAGGSSSGTVNPVQNTASAISSILSKTGDPVPNMENIASGLLGPLLVLQAGFFLLTKILTIPQSLDSWWTSLNFLGGTPVCLGQNSQSQISSH
uniref:Truncated large S protein n=1 Tax=Hepatitis B virus TaxID=10407 RepID=J7H0E8_HBV|nr:truncated large S protein [Hepatitis B virus]